MHRWQLRPFTLDLATKLDLLGFRLTLAPRKQDGSSLGFEKIIVSDVYFGEIEISVEYLGGSQNFCSVTAERFRDGYLERWEGYPGGDDIGEMIQNLLINEAGLRRLFLKRRVMDRLGKAPAARFEEIYR